MQKVLGIFASAALSSTMLFGSASVGPVSFSSTSKTADAAVETTARFADDHVIMSVTPDFDIDSIGSYSSGAVYLYGTTSSSVYRVDLDEGFTVDEAISDLSDLPDVNYVEADGILDTSAAGGSFDTLNPYQWFHDAIRTQDAWNQMSKLPKLYRTRVAVIDGYCNYFDSDIVSSTNLTYARHFKQGEKKYIDWSAPKCEHSNYCASVIAANPKDGNGIAGIACGPDNNLCDLVCLGLDEVKMSGTDVTKTNVFASSLAAAIVYASDIDCKVISISLGCPSYQKSLEEAVNTATSKGSICICSAGNDGASVKNYPACCSKAISVGNLTVNSSGKLARASSSSYAKVDISAPGTQILTKDSNYGTRIVSGTSLSAPMVAGCVALLISIDPSMTGTQAYNIVRSTADDVGATGVDIYTGYGCINCYSAVRSVVKSKFPGYLMSETSSSASLPQINEKAVDTNDVVKLLVNVASNIPNGGKNNPYLEKLLSGEVTIAAFLDKELNTSNFWVTYNKKSDTDFIKGVFGAVLGRAPSSTELKTYQTYLNSNSRVLMLRKFFTTSAVQSEIKTLYPTLKTDDFKSQNYFWNRYSH